MNASFKTCLFGGFDREDVISYIEKTAKEQQEKLQGLTEEKDALALENTDLSEQLSSLRDISDKYQALAEEHDALRTRADDLCAQVCDLTGRLQSLTDEITTLREQAQEYQSLKDHIAEIEISAHRRTEEFRAAAVAKLHELVGQQREWLGRRRAQYTELHNALAAQIRSAQEALGALDLTGFDRIDESLQELDRKIDE